MYVVPIHVMENWQNIYVDETTMEVVEEQWLPVVGYEQCYIVSNLGNVIAIERVRIEKNGKRKLYKQKKLLPYIKRKYYTVNLYSKKQATLLIHRLVAKAFIPNPENKREVNHIDGNKLNNRLENLEWCTMQENMEHAGRTGLMKHGEDHRLCQLTNEQIIEIKEKIKMTPDGHLQDIANSYGIRREIVWVGSKE